VLLSPASASFDEFAGYEERGERFVAIVQSFKDVAETRIGTDDIDDEKIEDIETE
jgi:hypothetical protein